ncbi:MAG: ribokinase [Candidatus Methanomethylicaceae archaeon]
MSNAKGTVVTVGSINIDLVAYTKRRPIVGETIIGEDFKISPGGKGSNQAIQAAISGANSYMVGRIGDDVFAPLIFEVYKKVGVNYEFVIPDSKGTGIGHVIVGEDGDYSAIMIPRANSNLCPKDVDNAISILQKAQVLLLQLEIPLSTVIHAARIAKSLGIKVFLNAAPVQPLPSEIFSLIDVLIVNEIEAEMLAGMKGDGSVVSYETILRNLKRLASNVVLTLGDKGVIGINQQEEMVYLGAHAVKAVNTVGAGDAFIGELAARMTENLPLLEALPYANAAGAFAVTQDTSTAIWIDREAVNALLDSSKPIGL